MSTFERRILIVDDSPAIHADFGKILCPAKNVTSALEATEAALFGDSAAEQTKSGFKLDFASQGQEALELVRRALAEERPYMIAFVDVRMPPGWDGIETTARIWAVDPGLQVVICTAYSDYSWDQMVSRLSQPDKFVILKKPFDNIEVLQLANAFTEKWLLQHQVEEHTRKLQESERRYHFLADSMPGLVWTAKPDGAVDYANQRLEDYSGRTMEQNSGWGWQGMVHPDDLPSCMERWTGSVRTGNAYQVEYRLKRAADGTYRWHLGRALPMRNDRGEILHWAGTSIDIEDQKRAEEELRQAQVNLEKRVEERTAELAEAKARFQAVLDGATHISIVATDPSGLITVFNAGAEGMLGYAAEEMVGRQTPAVIHLESEVAARGRELTALFGRPIAGFDVLVEFARQGKHEEREWTYVRKNGSHLMVTLVVTALRNKQGELTGFLGVAKDITERKRADEELRAQKESFRALTDNAPDAIARIDRDLRFVYVNRVMENGLGMPATQFLGKTNSELGLPAQAEWDQACRRVFQTGQMESFEFEHANGPDGPRFLEARLVPEQAPTGEVQYVLAVTRDVTEQKRTDKERQLMEVQLRQAQKLESIGQLAAGIAHEINTPTQYVGDNTRFLKDSFEDIATILQVYDELLRAAKTGTVAPDLIARVEAVLAANDLGYLFEQIPAAVKETLEGVERVTKIVRAMKEFSHPGGKEKFPADLNQAIESTVMVARNEWKYVADMQLELDPTLPAVPCFIGEFNQVILNLIVNAAHAIGDMVKQHPGTRGTITVRTRRERDQVEIRVADTGTGIPEAVRPKIFEPFFTTKEVGKGTGQGLTIVYGSIVKKHGGTVDFETEVGQGTTFILRLPLLPRTDDPASPQLRTVPASKPRSVPDPASAP